MVSFYMNWMMGYVCVFSLCIYIVHSIKYLHIWGRSCLFQSLEYPRPPLNLLWSHGCWDCRSVPQVQYICACVCIVNVCVHIKTMIFLIFFCEVFYVRSKQLIVLLKSLIDFCLLPLLNIAVGKSIAQRWNVHLNVELSLIFSSVVCKQSSR